VNVIDNDNNQGLSIIPNPDVIGIALGLIPCERTLVYWPDTRLSKQCNKVVSFNPSTDQIILDLIYTMRKNNGIGIAAPQLGSMLNIIIIECAMDYSNPVVLINPKILEIDQNMEYRMTEGCLSVPGYYEERIRSQRVVVEYVTPKNVKKTKEFQGMAAFVLQHEMEHLEGKVFVDDLSKLKKDRVLTKMKKTLKRVKK